MGFLDQATEQKKSSLQDINRSVFDVTVGAFEYGAADTASAVAKRVDRGFNTDLLQGVVGTLDDFKRDHPEYAPKHVDHFWQTITDPEAFSGMIFGQAPYMLATVAAGSVGPALAGGLAYAVESQNAYDLAKMSGATENEASSASQITGIVNAGLQMLRVGQLIGVTKQGLPTVAEAAIKAATGMTKGLNLTGPAIKHAAVQGLEMALQGAVRDGSAYHIYGLDEGGWEGWVDRRLQDMIGGAVASEVFGIGGIPLRGTKGLRSGEEVNQRVLDNHTRGLLKDQAVKQFGFNPTQADAVMSMLDVRAKRWAKQYNKNAEEFYPKYFASEKGDASVTGVYFQTPESVDGFYTRLDELLGEGFEKSFGKKPVAAASVLQYLQNKGVKKEEMTWTGMQDLLEGMAKPEVNDKVSQAELQEFLGKNRIQLETTLKRKDPLFEEKKNSLLEQSRKLYDEVIKPLQEKRTDLTSEENKTYTDASNKRAALLQQVTDLRREDVSHMPKWSQYTLPGPKSDYQELLIRLPKEKQAKAGKKGEFKHEMHFEESNVLVHLRMDMRDLGDGSKTLFLEEMQSDWHQQGAQRGYSDENKPVPTLEDLGYKVEKLKPFNEAEAFKKAIEVSKANGVTLHQQESFYAFFSRIQTTALEELHMSRPESGQQYKIHSPDTGEAPLELRPGNIVSDHELEQATQEILDLHGHKQTVPSAPFRGDAWKDLGLKYALLRAMQLGADRIAWTTGKQQDERYRLSEYAPKEAETIKRFYDKDVPKSLLKLVQKWDKGAKIELGELQTKHLEVPEGITNEQLLLGPQYIRENWRREPNDTPTQITRKALKDFRGGFPKHLEKWLVEIGAKEVQDTIPSIKLSKSISRGMIDDGFPLFYPNKASTTFLSDSRAIINALENPSPEAFIHEIGHVLRRQIDGTDKTSLETALGIKDGNWDIPSEEKFAKTFEKYIKEGRAPSGDLAAPFHYLKKMMTDIYRKARSYFADIHVSDEVRGIMDRLLVEDSPTVASIRTNLSDQRKRLVELETMIGKGPKDEELGDLNKLDVREMEQRIEQTQKDLTRAQMKIYDPRQLTDSELLAKEDIRVFRGPLNPDESLLRKKIRTVKDGMYRMVSMIGPLQKYVTGKRLEDGLNEMTGIVNDVRGEYVDRIGEVHEGLSGKDIDFLQENSDGFSGFRRLNDPQGSPEHLAKNPKEVSEGLRNYFSLADEIGRRVLQEAVKRGVLRKLPSGSYVKALESTVQRMPRNLTSDGYVAIEKGSGPVFDGWVNLILKHNPWLSRDMIIKDLKENYGPDSIRRLGSLERSRRIKYMPDLVEVGGRLHAVMHTEPYMALLTSLEHGMRRIGMIEQFGQGVLKNVKARQLRGLVENSGKLNKISADDIREELIAKGMSEEAVKGHKAFGKNATLNKVAEEFGVTTMNSDSAIKDAFMETTAEDYKTANDRSRVRSLARSIRGIDEKLPIDSLLVEIKKRIDGTYTDRLEELRKLFQKEGGDVRDFDQVLRVAQGLPYGVAGKREMNRFMRFTSNVIGGLQTSLSVAPNIPQTLIQVPRLFGMKNYVGSVKEVLENPKLTGAQLRALGAIPDTRFLWTSEPGQWLENIGKTFRNVIAGGTGQRWIGERNNLIAGETARRFAVELRAHGADEADLNVLRQLRLTDKDISTVAAGKMSDETFGHIVRRITQAAVAKTQYVTEAPYYRGHLENVPMMKMLFAYNSYASGTLRNTIEWGKDIVKSVSSKDPTQMFHAGKQIVGLVGLGLGAGYLSTVLRQAVKGEQVRALDETEKDKLLGAFLEVQLMGPTQRMLDPFRYDGGVIERAMIGTMPQVKFLGDFVGALLGYGTFGKAPAKTRFYQQAKLDIPLYKAIDNYVDHLAFPDLAQYQKAIAARKTYERKVLDREPSVAETQIEPAYFKVFQHVQRFDQDGAVGAFRQFMQDDFQGKLKITDKKGIEPLMGLRQSLVARSPLNLNEFELMRFLGSLPEDQRQTYVKAHLQYMAIVNSITPTPKRR